MTYRGWWRGVVGRKVLLVLLPRPWRVTKVVGMERMEEESSVSEGVLLVAPMVMCGRLFLLVPVPVPVPGMWECRSWLSHWESRVVGGMTFSVVLFAVVLNTWGSSTVGGSAVSCLV